MALQQDTKKKTAVLAFGRMNPPTTGHEAMIKKTHEVAKQHGGTAHVVASHSQDKDKNPLPQDKKLGYIRKIAHPDVNVSGSSKEHPSIMHHAAKLHAAGHTHLHVVSDKHEEFHKTLNKYNNKKGPHGHYNFKSITTSDSGKRDPKASGVTGMSGSKMRHYSRSGQHDKFKQGLPKALHPHAKEIHGHIGGTQLESFKEAVINSKKKFKPSGKKTQVIVHAMPTADRSDSTYGLKGSGKGAPANTTRSGGARFGEHRIDNKVLSINSEFEDFIGEPLLEEIDPHIKTMIDNGDSNEKIKKMHPKVTNDELKKLREEQIDEVLSRQGRIKRALLLRRYKHKIQRRKKIMRKKLATKEMLHRRARRHAVKLTRKRFMGKKGEQYHTLGMADKIMIDKKLATKKKIIDRIAARLMPKIRRAELIRLRNMKKGKPAPKVIAKTTPQKPVAQARWKTPGGTTKPAVASYRIPVNVKSEGYVTEDNVFDIVDSFDLLTEKDMVAIEKKFAKTDIDSNILFEVFLMGLEEEGDKTPQQKGFQSLNTFIAGVDKQLSEAMADWNDEPIQGVQVDRRYTRPMIKRSTVPSLREFQATGERSFVSDPVDPKKIDWKDSHTLAAYKMGKSSGNGKKNPFHKKNDPEGQLHTCWNMGNRGDKIPEALEYPHETAKKYKKDTPGQKNEEKKNCGCGQDPCITYGKQEKVDEAGVTAASAAYEKSAHAGKGSYDDWAKHTLAKSRLYKLTRYLEQNPGSEHAAQWKKQKAEQEAIVKRTAVKEDAEAMMRVAASQAGEKDRLKLRHKRELEALAGRQKMARERARAALPTRARNEEFEKFITEYGTDTARKWTASQYAAMRDKKLNPPKERKPGDPAKSTIRLNLPISAAERERQKKKAASLTTDNDRKRNRAAIDAARKARAGPNPEWGFPKKTKTSTGGTQLRSK